ncbi:hypothetical protein PV326_006685 [Microctonus aethiopoides]|nr:hypothetical protein PV326_006685 [Microctonus aethiopoides]
MQRGNTVFEELLYLEEDSEGSINAVGDKIRHFINAAILYWAKSLIQVIIRDNLNEIFGEKSAAVVFNRSPYILPTASGTFVQYVADNTDISVNTLDSNSTLYIIGIIQIVTPKSSVLLEELTPRIKEVLSAKNFAAEALVPI